MVIFSVVPDTNVLIENLDLIEYLDMIKGDFYIYIYISKVVVEELDKLKLQLNGAKKAINFLYKTKSEIIVLEGDKSSGKIEVEVENLKKVEEKTNDDKILNYAKALENPVLLTNDQNLCLKCQMNNVCAVTTFNKNNLNILEEILASQNLQISTVNQTYSYRDYVAYQIIMNIKEIVLKEFGNLYPFEVYSTNLIDVLEMVVQNFNIFQKYLPKYSKKHFKLLREAIITHDEKNIDIYLQKVAFVFGITTKQ